MDTKLKPAVKKARVFVIRKITRRIKVLKEKKGTERQRGKNRRKVDRLRKDIDVLKDINLDIFCQELLDKLSYFREVGSIYSRSNDSSDDIRLKKRLVDTKVLRNALCKIKDKMAKDDGHRKMSGFVRESEGDSSENDQVVTCSFDGTVPDSVSKRKILHKTKERKNRRGQRSRRRLSEQRFGVHALHISKESASNGRSTKGKGQPELVHPSWEAAKGKGQPELVHPSWEAAKGKGQPELVHPSWEAAKKVKQKTTSITAFCGSRTLFTDLD